MSFKTASTVIALAVDEAEKLQRLDDASDIGSLIGELADWEGWAWYRNQCARDRAETWPGL